MIGALRVVVYSLVAIVLTACGGDGPAAPIPVASVSVSLPGGNIIVGQSYQLVVALKDGSGNAITGRTIAWTSSNDAVATVSTTGLLSAVAVGNTTITATAEGKAQSVQVTVKPVPVASIDVSATAPTLQVGSTLALTVVLRDAAGGILTGRAVGWSSDANAIATVSSDGVVTGHGVGVAVITASSEGKTRTLPITVVPKPVASIAILGAASSMLQGAILTLTAETRAADNSVVTGHQVEWSTNAPSVATVSNAGVVSGVSGGEAVITAASEGKVAQVTIEVTVPPVATVQVFAESPVMSVGTTRQMAVVLRDAANNVLSGRTVTFESDATLVATVDATGLVTAVAPGTATITASSEGQSGTIVLTVTQGPAITNVLEPVLLAGATATIQGLNFSPVPGANTVTIGGVAATIAAESATQLTVSVPCMSSGPVAIVVSHGGVPSAPFSKPLQVTQQTLAPGESVILTSSAEATCNEIPAAGGSARYLVTAFNSSSALSNLTSIRLRGSQSVAGGAAAAVVRMPSAAMLVRHVDPSAQKLAEYERVHLQHMERDRAEYQRLRARAAAMPHRVVREAMNVSHDLGDSRSFFYTLAVGCNNSSQVMQTRAIFVGARSVIWEDQANAQLSTNNSALAGFYQRLGQIYESDQHETISSNFGDPLRRDAALDADGKIHMVFSQRLNGTGAAAYVTSCDQFPNSVAPGSNFGEVFYGSVPTSSGSNVNSTNFADGWFYFMARTVVHEVKHIASQSARVANGAPSYEQSWLEEGTARIAEEMWVRKYLYEVPWKSNAGWSDAGTNALYCDFHPADATCNAADDLRRPSYGMRRQFNELLPKLQAPHSYSPYGQATGQAGSVFYQTVWSLVRYAIDRFGSSDAAFLTALTNSTTSGVTNLLSVSGTTLDQLIGGWGMALYADDYPGMPITNTATQFQTWNLRSIYAGLHAAPNWSGRFNTPFPIAPAQATFGNFMSASVTVRGGAHAYFELSGALTAPQLLQLQSASGGAPATTMRLAIVRLQ